MIELLVFKIVCNIYYRLNNFDKEYQCIMNSVNHITYSLANFPLTHCQLNSVMMDTMV